MSFEEALNFVRKQRKDDLIWYAFEHNGGWVFTMTLGKKFYPGDASLFGVFVKDGTVKIMSEFWYKYMTDKDFYKDSLNRRYVDVTEEQAKMLG